MSEIQAFRGLRYDLGHVGSLSEVIAPPYDVIGPELQEQLYKRHPANVIRLELNRDEPGDDEASNKYTRAARFLRNWKSEGVLFTEPDAAIYVYHQIFDFGGQQYTRKGFMCRLRLSRFGEGQVFPHEETLSGPKADRLLLFKATKANLSQVFGLYPDPQNEAQDIFERAIVGKTALEATDHLGVLHRMWPISELEVIRAASAVMTAKPFYIADGHHRYETACNYRDWLAEKEGGLPSDHPANFVLMMCVGMSDPGMIVMPTHRLFRGLPALTSDELIARLGDSFSTRVVGEGADLANNVWDEIETEDEQGAIGFFTTKDDRWVLARITLAGRKRMAEVSPDHSTDWQELGVAILHRLVVNHLLGEANPKRPEYVHLVSEVVSGLENGDPEGGVYPLAALVMPATVDHIRAISNHNERMPAKSTYFYPKLLSGLVFNPLE